jgi:hypothetical protein
MAFVKRYILGLRRIGTSSLKGIIRVYTHFKFRSPPASEMSDPPSSFASPPEADPDDVTYVLSPPRRLRRSTKAPAHTPPSAYGSSRSSKKARRNTQETPNRYAALDPSPEKDEDDLVNTAAAAHLKSEESHFLGKTRGSSAAFGSRFRALLCPSRVRWTELRARRETRPTHVIHEFQS